MVGTNGISRRQFVAGSGTAITLTGLYGVGAVPGAMSMQTPAPATPADGASDEFQAQGIVPVVYSDVDGRGGAFKLAIQEVDDRWLLYMGHLWHGGWTIMDVTDPSQPQVVNFIDGPENTWTIQMEVAEDKMITALEHKPESWGGDPNAPSEEGVLIWDLSQNPVDPQLLGHYRTGGSGTHRNFYAGGPYVHLAAGMPGYSGNIYVIIDISDPASPREVSRWSLPEQNVEIAEPAVSLHGPPYVVGNLVYLPYGAAGLVILDITDVSQPMMIGQLDFSPPFIPFIGAHSALPLPERNLTVVMSEAIRSSCDEPLNHISLVDTADPADPVLVSIFPVPEPPPGSPYQDFCEKGGRFGPHNLNQHYHSPFTDHSTDLVYAAYFNAGLRVFNIENPTLPKEVAYFIPPDPTERFGPQPPDKLVLQSEDVLVDSRGYIYLSNKNQGIWILQREES